MYKDYTMSSKMLCTCVKIKNFIDYFLIFFINYNICFYSYLGTNNMINVTQFL